MVTWKEYTIFYLSGQTRDYWVICSVGQSLSSWSLLELVFVPVSEHPTLEYPLLGCYPLKREVAGRKRATWNSPYTDKSLANLVELSTCCSPTFQIHSHGAQHHSIPVRAEKNWTVGGSLVRSH